MKNTDVLINNAHHQFADNSAITIYYVDGLCGAGKTNGLGHYIQQSASHKKFLITTPSKALADQIYTQLNNLGIGNLHKIYSTDDRSSNVPADIIAAISEVNLLGNGCILCTQQVFPRIGFFENKNEWILIVDEIPKVDKFDAPSLPYNHKLISQYARITENIGIGLYEVEGNQDCERMGHCNDDIDNIIRHIVEDLYSPNYRCFTDKNNWDRLVIGNRVSDDKIYDKGYGNDKNKLFFLRLLQPSIYQGFTQVIMMGANFEHSLLHKYWSDYCGVIFKPFTTITNQLRYKQYANGSRLTIRYLQEKDWSKYAANTINAGKSRLDYFADKVRSEMGDQKFIYMTNNSDDTFFENGIKAPVISHGINDFSHIHNIYFSPALNNQPKHSAMLADLGFSPEFIKRATSYEVAHQAIMRTSLRNPNCNEPVTAIVVDKKTAEYLAGLFPGCRIGPMDGCLKEVIALNNQTKSANHRLKKLIELKQLNAVVTHSPNADLEEKMHTDFSYREFGVQNFPNKKPDFLDPSFGVSFLSSIYNKSLVGIKSSPMDFVKTMQGIHTNHIIREKDESLLFNGVTYKTEQSRALANVEFATLVVVDIDNGDLSPDMFYKIFTEQVKHSFFMCNSFSRCEETPNNFRAIFFINQVVNDEIYRDIQVYLQRIINKAGYITCWPKDRQKHLDRNPIAKFSGIDLSKTHTASFFYIPCRVENRLEWAFFKRGNLKDEAQLKRYAIDVEKAIQYMPEDFERPTLQYKPTQSVGVSNSSNDESYDLEAIKSHIMNGDFKHLGEHHTYGRMAVAMKNTGFTLADFIELTPYISKSKTSLDATKYWESWGNYSSIGRGTLLHFIGYKQKQQ